MKPPRICCRRSGKSIRPTIHTFRERPERFHPIMQYTRIHCQKCGRVVEFSAGTRDEADEGARQEWAKAIRESKEVTVG